MKRIYIVAIAVFLLTLPVIAFAFTPSWTYEIDTLRFIQSNPQPQIDKPAPGVWIDTHIEISGMFGGTIKSYPPFDVAFDYTDIDRLYACAEFTSIAITDVEVVEVEQRLAEPDFAVRLQLAHIKPQGLRIGGG